jgi:protein required for attachment to host cells
MPHRESLWIVVADGEHARIVVRDTETGALHTAREITSASAGARSADLGTDRPGRSFESGQPGRHAITPRHDLHEEEKEKFLHAVAAEVNAAAAAHRFHRLLLVAPSRAMAPLRAALSAEAEARVAHALAKDLVKVPDHELHDHVRAWLLP